jgi:hypothetical protein
MNTLHYNGSIVTHPDNSDSFNKRIAKNLQSGKCVYGKSCLNCPIYLAYERDKQNADNPRDEILTGTIQTDHGPVTATRHFKSKNRKPRMIIAHECSLYKTPECPHNVEARAYGLKEKTFCITNRVRNQISDRGAWMFQNQKNKLLFATLTVPPFKIQINNGNKEKLLNQAFSKFIENARAHYGLHRYIAVREGDGIRKRYHYHVIFDIPFVDFAAINNAWVHTLADFCHHSRNAFTTDKKARTIRSIASATRYIAKYISKAGHDAHPTRVFFCDRETANAVVTMEIDHTPAELREIYPLEGYKYNDYVIRYTIRDRILSDKFFYEVVRAMFSAYEKRVNDPEFIFFTDQ